MSKLIEKDLLYLLGLADALDGATRFSDDHLREPGALWVELGDTPARQIAGRLRAIAWGPPDDGCKPIVENVRACTLCCGPVDRFEHCFQCRDCGALGALMTGIMLPADYKPQVAYRPRGEETDGDADDVQNG